METVFIFVCTLLNIFSLGASFEVAGLDVFQCEGFCDTSASPPACKRGCRFFSLINFVNDHPDLNVTLEACKEACNEAHTRPECQTSCGMGCQNQLPLTEAYRQRMDALSDPLDYYMSPFLYVNNIYSNMVEKVHNQVSISWSFYVQSGRGAMVVVRSEPTILAEWNPSFGESKTSNYIETNLAENDNSATPNLKSSQLHIEGRSYDIHEDEATTDWLGCVARKTGLPRLLLSVLLIGCSVGIVWLCVATSVSSVEHRSSPEKLSIYGDLDYLHSLDCEDDDKPYVVKMKQQDLGMEAAPLPIKIKIESV